MFSEDDFSGMYEGLRARFEERVLPVVRQRDEINDRLARLEEQEKMLAGQAEHELPQRKEAVLRDVTRRMAEGQDAPQERKALREIEQEIADTKEIASNLAKVAIPAAKQELARAGEELDKARQGALAEVRAGYLVKIRGVFNLVFAVDEQWRGACARALQETGLSYGNPGHEFQLLPVPQEIKGLIERFR